MSHSNAKHHYARGELNGLGRNVKYDANVMFIVARIFVPIVLSYTAYAFT